MTEQPQEEEVQHADYYQSVAGGLTVGMTVLQEGEVVEGNAMGFTKSNPPMSEEEQEDKWGVVLYKEYTPSEEELAAIKAASGRIRTLSGMQSPGEPPVVNTGPAKPELSLQSRAELRARAKSVGLNFPADTDREQMIGAIEKKEKEQADAAAEEATAAQESAAQEPPAEEEVPNP